MGLTQIIPLLFPPTSLSTTWIISLTPPMSMKAWLYKPLPLTASRPMRHTFFSCLIVLKCTQKLFARGASKRHLGRVSCFEPISGPNVEPGTPIRDERGVVSRSRRRDQFIIEMRINSDSLVMMRVKNARESTPPPLNVTFEPAIVATYAPHYENDGKPAETGHIMHMDEKGGVSLASYRRHPQ